MQYPPLDQYVHERPDLPTPSKPKLKGTSCAYRSKFRTLDESQSAIFIDEAMGKVVGIVLRDFAAEQSAGILFKGEQLIHDSLNRR